MKKTHVLLRLARQEFRIVCDDDAAYLEELERSVNKKINEVQEKYPSMSTLRCVLLAMLNTEDELRKKNDCAQTDDEMYGASKENSEDKL